ncbi:MAG: M28 family peptidase, partial [Sphingomonadales bacterium]
GKAPRTDRSILFLAVTAEEKGLLGSRYYGGNPVWPLGKTVGMINLDAVIGEGAAKDFSISGLAKLDLLDLLIAEGKKLGRSFTPDPNTDKGYFFRSDHFPMAQQGVPAISFETGLDLVDGGLTRGRELETAYTRDRYHQPADQWEPGMDLSNIVPDLTLVYNTGRALANSRSWPQWSADSEFRAKRDESAADRK